MPFLTCIRPLRLFAAHCLCLNHNQMQLSHDTRLQNGTRIGRTDVYIHNDITGKTAPRLVVTSKLDEGTYIYTDCLPLHAALQTAVMLNVYPIWLIPVLEVAVCECSTRNAVLFLASTFKPPSNLNNRR